MKKRIFLNVLIPALVLSSCGGNQGNKVAGYVPEVRVFAVDSSCMSHVSKEFVGKADDSFTAVLSFPVSGNVGKIYVREGGRVEAGDLVAELDPRTAENALAAARASYDRAEDGYRRAKEVYEKGSLPEVKWIEVVSQRDQAAALFDIAKKNLEDCRLYAPASGVISSVLAEQGMNVPPYRPIAELTDPDAIEVEINVPENEISSFSLGDEASVAVPSMNLEGVPAVIVSKGVEADLLSHGYSVRLAVTGRFGILPGMTCKVSFAPQVGAAEVFMVPGRAVSLSNDGRRYVWVVAGDGTVSRKYVDVYSAGPDGVLVSGGLEAGDAVVSDGIQKISEGMKVVVKN